MAHESARTPGSELISSQLTRNYNFLGEEAMAKVRNGYVVVVGCGGVGSWCALMLLRRCVQPTSRLTPSSMNVVADATVVLASYC
jgi:tRNA A37 threonylcarbamoyladenosine dehydratase